MKSTMATGSIAKISFSSSLYIVLSIKSKQLPFDWFLIILPGYIQKNVEPVLSFVPRCEGLRITLSVGTNNAESPTPCHYIIHPLRNRAIFCRPTPVRGYIQYHLWGVPVALFLTDSWKLRSSHIVKCKTFSYAFYVYMSFPCLHPP